MNKSIKLEEEESNSEIEEIDEENRVLIDALRIRPYIIRERSNLREYWDYIIIVITIYNCVWMPLTLSFDWASTKAKENVYLIIIDTIILIFYTVDIVIHFLTSYYNITTGDEIMKPSWIAYKYIFGAFMIDFLSTFPFRYFTGDSKAFEAFAASCELLKVLRIQKIYAIISQANLTIEAKSIAKIAYIFFLLIIYTHIVGCVMWYFLKNDYEWVAPTDFGAIRSRMHDPLYTHGFEGKTEQIMKNRQDFDLFLFQWLQMWYHSTLTLLLVEITARSATQMVILIIIYMTNGILEAILFSLFEGWLLEANRRKNEF